MSPAKFIQIPELSRSLSNPGARHAANAPCLIYAVILTG